MHESVMDMVKRHEGLRLHPYVDTAGKLTIGYGRNLSDVGITHEEADALFARDFEEASRKACEIVGAGYFKRMDGVRQAVLIDMAFNLGNRLATFVNTLRMIREGDYFAAALEMLRSRWAQQVGKRAEELSEMMRTGEWGKGRL